MERRTDRVQETLREVEKEGKRKTDEDGQGQRKCTVAQRGKFECDIIKVSHCRTQRETRESNVQRSTRLSNEEK